MIKIKKGEEIVYHDTIYKIQRVIDIKTILAKSEDGEVLKIPISEIMPPENKDKTHKAFEELSEKEWKEAKRRFEIINPLLTPKRTKKDVITRAKEFSGSFKKSSRPSKAARTSNSSMSAFFIKNPVMIMRLISLVPSQMLLIRSSR